MSRKNIIEATIATVIGGVLLVWVLWFLVRTPSAVKAIVSFVSTNAIVVWSFVSLSVSVPLWLVAIGIIPSVLLAARIAQRMRKPRQATKFDYKEDTFHGIVWRWRYLGRRLTPVGLAAFCTADDMALVAHLERSLGESNIVLVCERCGRRTSIEADSLDFMIDRIIRMIDLKLRNGQWKHEIDARQRLIDSRRKP